MDREFFSPPGASAFIKHPVKVRGFRYTAYLKQANEHKVYLQTSTPSFRVTPNKVMKDLRKLELYESCVVSVVAVVNFPAVNKCLGKYEGGGKRAKRS